MAQLNGFFWGIVEKKDCKYLYLNWIQEGKSSSYNEYPFNKDGKVVSIDAARSDTFNVDSVCIPQNILIDFSERDFAPRLYIEIDSATSLYGVKLKEWKRIDKIVLKDPREPGQYVSISNENFIL